MNSENIFLSIGMRIIEGDFMKYISENQSFKIYFPEDAEKLTECILFINEHEITKLGVFTKDSNCYSLTFLSGIQKPESIKNFSLEGCYQPGKFLDYDYIYLFSSLVELSTSISDKKVIDLSRFSMLKTLLPLQLYPFYNLEKSQITRLLYGGAIRHCKCEKELLCQLTAIKELRLFCIDDFSLHQIIDLKNLESLSFTQCNIRNFDGIEKLKKLRFISPAYCRSLERIEGISKTNIETIWLDCCPRLKDLNEISQIKRLKNLVIENMKDRDFRFLEKMQCREVLEFLMLFNCGSISTVKILDDYPNLQEYNGAFTNIIDGDLTPLLRLEGAVISNRRHYNIKEEDLPNGGKGLLSRVGLI